MIKKTLALIVPIVAVAAVAMVPSAALAGTTGGKCPKGVSNKNYCIDQCPPGTAFHKYCVVYVCPPGVTDLKYCKKIVTSPSDIKLASIDGVASKSGSVGVVFACFGTAACKGTVTISQFFSHRRFNRRVVLGTGRYDIPGDDVGVVNVQLSRLALFELQVRSPLLVDVSAIDFAGPSASGHILLYLFCQTSAGRRRAPATRGRCR